MDPLDYFFQVSSLGSQFSKKVIQITKRGKMGEIRVLTKKWPNFDFFYLIPGLLVGSMISRIRARNFDLISHFNSSPEISGLIDKIWSTGGKSQLYTKKSNFDFLTKVESQKSYFIKTSKIWNLIIKNKESQKSNFCKTWKFF